MNLLTNFKHYKSKFIINDILSGLLVAIIAMPLSIALGLQSVGGEGYGIQMGIITAIVAGFCISAFGGCKFQIGGPTAAFVVIIVGYISSIGLIGLQLATICAGIILIVLGFLKCGNLVKYIPYPIVVGFTTGIGITLLVGQLNDLCSFNGSGENFIEKISSYIANFSNFNLPSFIMGLLTLTAIIVLSKVNKKIPGAFISIIFFTLINVLIGGENLGIITIGQKYGDIKASFSVMDFSNIASIDFTKIIVPTIVIAFLCAIESLLSVTVADGITKTTSNYNQELKGQGLANICSSLLGGLPATGAIARTSASIDSGAKSCLAGIFHAVFMFIMYFALMGVVKFIPLCTLSAVLINVAINICNTKLFIKMAKFGIRDGIVLIFTMLLTVFLDLTYGVLGGIALTILINIQNIKKGFKMNITNEENKANIKITGAVFFLTINKLIDEINRQVEKADDVIVDLSLVKRIDCTSIEKLAKTCSTLMVQGKALMLIGYNDRIGKRIENYYQFMM